MDARNGWAVPRAAQGRQAQAGSRRLLAWQSETWSQPGRDAPLGGGVQACSIGHTSHRQSDQRAEAAEGV